MPVAKSPKFDLRSGLIFGGLAVVTAIILGIVAVQLGSQSNRLVLGDPNFGSISADGMAATIAENGPVLWPDIASGNRDIWLQHIGDTPGEGWTAFDARLPGTGRACNVTWSVTDQTFSDPCTGDIFPASGEGLPQIPVFIDQRTLVIDINGVHDASEFAGYTS